MLKNYYHWVQARFWRLYYGKPDAQMELFGVTGTNGKTTTSIVFGSILREAYGKDAVGLLSTIVFWLGEEERVNETKMTTIDSKHIFRLLAEMRQRGVKHVVIEVTSHALDQHRLAGIGFSGAIVTNIAREHLDYHGTMERYATAKAKILDYVDPQGVIVAKSDDTWVRKVLYPETKKRTIVWFTRDQARSVVTPLPGNVNKENVLAAMLLAKAAGISHDAIAKGVERVEHVPGRFEWIGSRVLIDYAVTPDALDRLYRDVREQVLGKIIAVLGAAGMRDRGKRPDMARVVAQYADMIILTREDPWEEDEEQIFSDLEQGLEDTTTSWIRIADRRDALARALSEAGADDVVVVTGKGAETGMGVGKNIVPWNDKEVILELLRDAGRVDH